MANLVRPSLTYQLYYTAAFRKKVRPPLIYPIIWLNIYNNDRLIDLFHSPLNFESVTQLQSLTKSSSEWINIWSIMCTDTIINCQCMYHNIIHVCTVQSVQYNNRYGFHFQTIGITHQRKLLTTSPASGAVVIILLEVLLVGPQDYLAALPFVLYAIPTNAKINPREKYRHRICQLNIRGAHWTRSNPWSCLDLSLVNSMVEAGKWPLPFSVAQKRWVI